MPEIVISTLPDEELMRQGSRLPAGALSSQAGTTLKLAGGDQAGIEEILGVGFLDATGALQAKVDGARKEHTVADDQSKQKTIDQGNAVHEVILWRRKALKFGDVLQRRGVTQGRDLGKITSPNKSVGNLREEVKAKVGLMRAAASLAPNPAYAEKLAAEGAALEGALGGKDANQEVDVKKLPERTRQAYLAMGKLYCALKQINDCGQSLHAADAKLAAEYNLEVLHRGRGKSGKGKAGGDGGNASQDGDGGKSGGAAKGGGPGAGDK